MKPRSHARRLCNVLWVPIVLLVAAGLPGGGPGIARAQVPSAPATSRPGEDQLWGAKRVFGFPSLPGAAQAVSVESRYEIMIGGERIIVVRDSWGVPHVLAETDHGLFAGQGYVQAEDRLWQMELWRRFARGELAEIDGEASLDSDVAMRLAGLGESELERNLGQLSARARSMYEAFSEGVNAYIDQARRSGRLPEAFAAYGILPRPWKATDSAANLAMFWKRVFWGGRNAQMRTLELFRLVRSRASSDRDAMNTVNDLCWVNDPAALTTVPGPAVRPRRLPAEPAPNLKAVLAMAPKLSTWAFAPVAGYEAAAAAARRFFLPTEAGSYMWLVGPRLSISGVPMLLSGPEMGFSSPQVTHEVHLSGNGLDIVGGGLIGIPGLLVGTNGHVTWGTTYGQSHLDDTFVEKLNPGNPEEYFYNGGYRPMEKRIEHFAVKGRQSPSIREFHRTVHGPVIGWDRPGNIALSLGAAFFGKEFGSMQAMSDFLYARDIREMGSAALQMSHGENWFAVARNGDIGWWYTGRYPMYKEGIDARFPMPGTGESEWTGVIAASALPHAINPPQGYIVNWNNKPAPGWDCPEAHLYSWGRNHRVENLRAVFTKRLAAAGGKLALTDLLAITHDIGLMGDGTPGALVPHLAAAVSAPGRKLSPEAKQAAAYLTGWDGRNSDWSVAPTLFHAWLGELSKLLFPFQGSSKEHVALWAQFTGAPAVLHALEGTRSGVPLSRSYTGGRPASEVVIEALENAVAGLKSRRRESMNFWTSRLAWIDLRPVPPIPLFRRGTYLFAAEMTPELLLYSVVVPGNSGDPRSPHFSDQRDLGGWYMFKRVAAARSQIPGRSEAKTN